jgi:hypothetical protein
LPSLRELPADFVALQLAVENSQAGASGKLEMNLWRREAHGLERHSLSTLLRNIDVGLPRCTSALEFNPDLQGRPG